MYLISSILCFHTINFAYEHQTFLSFFQNDSRFCKKNHWFCWLISWPWGTYVNYMWIQCDKQIQKNQTYFITVKKFCASSPYDFWKSWYLTKIFLFFAYWMQTRNEIFWNKVFQMLISFVHHLMWSDICEHLILMRFTLITKTKNALCWLAY